MATLTAGYIRVTMPDGRDLILPRPTLQAIEEVPRATVVVTVRRPTKRPRRPAELDDVDRDPRRADFFPRLRVPKSPDYSTAAEVTRLAISGGSGAGADIRAALKTNGKVYRELRKAIDKGEGR